MSNINTNGIDANYPIPGQNNSTQGFRNNFAAIKQNLNTAGTEITDLQNNVVLKSALANSVLNNDMANTLISNASTLSFRASTYNLGNALVGTVVIDRSLGDVQYGNLAGNINLQFGSWSPTDTLSNLELRLGRPDSTSNYTITLPGEAVIDQNSGWALLENSGSNGGATVTFPYDTTRLDFLVSTIDCGASLEVTPINRPFQAIQIQQRTPPPTGYLGDVAGTVAIDTEYLYVCTGTYDANTITSLNGLSSNSSTNVVTMDADVAAAGVSANMPVVFDTMFIDGNSVTEFGNINAGQVYYVKTISGANITLSDTRTGGTAGSTLALTEVTANSTTNMDATFYDGTDIWKRVSLTSW